MSAKINVLSLDGGGIRGVIPAVVLKYIEKKIIEESGNPNARIADLFDLIVGTSTGGILGCFYLIPGDGSGPVSRHTADEALKFYTERGYKIFNASKKSKWLGFRQMVDATQFSPKAIEAIFQEVFGDMMMDELHKHCVITTYDMKAKSAFFFNSREPKEQQRRFYLRDVVRSTSAAPTYFPPAIVKNLAKPNAEAMINLDGGVFANNPTMCAYAEARKTDFEQFQKPTAEDMNILSIGTGGGQYNLPDTGDVQTWNVLKWAKSIPEIMMDGSLDTVHHQMKNLYGAVGKEFQQNYKRIDVPVNARKYQPDMADASATNIAALITAGIETVKAARLSDEVALGLDEYIARLMKNRSWTSSIANS